MIKYVNHNIDNNQESPAFRHGECQNDLADKVIKQLFLNFFTGVYTTEEEREKLIKLGSAYLNEMAM